MAKQAKKTVVELAGLTLDEKFVLSRLIKEAEAKELRGLQTARTMDVDFAVRVYGNVIINDDEQYIPTVKVPVKTVLALFMRYSGVTGPHALTLLERAMTLAVLLGDKGEDAIKDFVDLDEQEKAIKAMFANLPKATRSGKVLASLSVEKLETEPSNGEETLEDLGIAI